VDTAYSNFLQAGTPRPNVTSLDWRAPVIGDRFDPDKEPFLSKTMKMLRTMTTTKKILKNLISPQHRLLQHTDC
jgi:hypothetical protein